MDELQQIELDLRNKEREQANRISALTMAIEINDHTMEIMDEYQPSSAEDIIDDAKKLLDFINSK